MFLVSLGAAAAQIMSPVTVDIKTEFVIGNATLPAGSYEILPTDDEGVLEIRGPTGCPFHVLRSRAN